ncbi:MAG: hypothetical protein ACLFMX_06715 [Halobacteriales archaeon]
MIRSLGLSGLVGIVAMLGGLAVLAWVDPVVAGGVALVFVGAALLVHAAVRAIAARFGMGDVV